MRLALKQSCMQMGIVILLIFLFCMSLVTFWYQAKIYTDVIIAEDVVVLADIFKKINEECGIIDFRYEKQNYVDFLNVISFEGSEIGTMNLHSPEKWKGPYLRENPTVQGKYYQVVHTDKGYFIVPGDGVKLKNGKVIGKDIIFDKNADIEKMMEDPQKLLFQDKKLAAQIEVSKEKPIVPLDEISNSD